MIPLRAVPTIRGFGGGDEGSSSPPPPAAPVEAPDSLRSRQRARVIDLVSEGEIGGLVAGLKSVYLDDTPVQNADGSYNFTGVTLVERKGTQSQSYIPGFPAVEAETSVASEIKYATPVVRSISNANVNAARVTLAIPALMSQDTATGDINGTSVQIAIDVQTNGGGYVTRLTDTISGKTTSRYQRSYRVGLSGGGPWDIRVRRLTADSTASALRNATWFDSYTEIIDAKLRYPNSALAATELYSDMFRSVPRRGFEIKGILCRVPSNYNPLTRVYTGSWDGTFVRAWTDNAAWCFYDMVIDGRYGCGDYIDAAQIDKWELYTIGQYCDALVDDGFGGLEPRFTCNLYLQAREEAFKVLGAMASIFRAMSYWAGGQVVAVQDAPADPVALFTAANVVDGTFHYTGSDRSVRHTVCLVAWNDPDDRYRQKIEYVSDDAGIVRWGIQQTDIVAVGCTSRGQAHRMGKWLLWTEQNETETVTFRAGLDAFNGVAPGRVVQVQDSHRSGSRFGGRIVSVAGASVTVDAAVAIEPGKTYELSVVLPDGTVQSRAVANAPGSAAVLALASAYDADPLPGAIWVLSSSSLVPTEWRVVSIAEVEPTVYEIVALAYRAEKFVAVESGILLEPLPTSSLLVVPPAPYAISHVESTYFAAPGVAGFSVTLSWSGTAPRYVVAGRRENDNWRSVEVLEPVLRIDGILPGFYEFQIYAINGLGRHSATATYNVELYGKLAPPLAVSGFSLAPLGTLALLTWNPAADADVIVGGRLVLRYSLDPAATWSAAVPIGVDVPGSATSAVVPLIAGTYLAKWEDASGNLSATATSIITDAANIIALNFVDSAQGHPGWTGTKTNTQFLTDFGALGLESADDWDSADLLDGDDMVDFGGGVATAGTYAMGLIDLGSVQTARVSGVLETSAADTISLWDAAEFIDGPDLVDGDTVSGLSATLWMRHTLDDPSGTPAWSAWSPLSLADLSARAYDFELRLEGPGGSYNVLVYAATASVDMPDRTEAFDDVVSGTATKSVAFASPFMAIPALGITAQDMQTGDYYQIANKAVTGFDITFKNAAGTAISRTFDVIARAY